MTVIEKNIPIPDNRRAGRKPNGTYSEVMGKLEVGDSFVAEGSKYVSVMSAVRAAAKRAGIKIVTRRIEDDDINIVKLRVWRIEGVFEPLASV